MWHQVWAIEISAVIVCFRVVSEAVLVKYHVMFVVFGVIFFTPMPNYKMSYGWNELALATMLY
jgi:hypothetical protein